MPSIGGETLPIKDLRVELRTRNNILWHAIFDTTVSVAEFCRIHQLEQSLVGRLLNLKASPYTVNRRQRVGAKLPTAQRLVEITGLGFESLFPLALYSGALPTRAVAELESREMLSLTAARRLALPATQDDVVLRGEQRERLTAALTTLTPREELVLRLRFGLDGEEENTLEAIGQQHLGGLTRETVLRIEQRAMRKLRHPSRAARLKGLIETYG